ncbi:MAG: hypothetical protein E7462_02765 [Ruminococcaceae bacterium]|nr:hypothetical protein [Oscillospiraceae bacterium]
MNIAFFRFLRGLLVITATLFLLTGCCRIHTAPNERPYRIVRCVQLFYAEDAVQSQRQYFHPEKLQQITDYLRFIRPYGTPSENPDTVQGRFFRITLCYSDGSCRIYEQKAERFMRIDGGAWKRIDPKLAQQLYFLWKNLSEDPLPRESPPPPLECPQI